MSSSVDWFHALSFIQIRQFCNISGYKKETKGEFILINIPESPRIFLLKKGAIKIVSRNEDGEEVIKDIYT